MNLQLKKFDMSNVAENSVTIYVARRGSGKSTLVKDQMYYHRDIPVGTIISPTEFSNKFYQNFVPKMFIHPKFDTGIIKNFVTRQKKMKKRINKYGENIDPRAYLIMDDCMYDNSWKRDVNINEIFFNGRWMGAMTILCLQDPMGLLPAQRNNVDYTFILKDTKISNRRKIYEHYASVFPTFEMFCAVMDQCTQNYECLVINNKEVGGKLEDQVFWYKADIHEDFRVGPDEIWRYSDENCKEDDDSDDEEININTYHSKKMPKVNVKKIVI